MSPTALSFTVLPASPNMALTHETRLASSTPAQQQQLNPRDPFSRRTFSSSSTNLARTHDSRHDNRDSMLVEPLPPYTADDPDTTLPAYTPNAPEPVTLAMYLFKFGFLFPPFWVFGAFIFFSDLREPRSSLSNGTTINPSWIPEKTEEEKRAILATLRATELKWARRSMNALFIFTGLVLIIGAGAWSTNMKGA